MELIQYVRVTRGPRKGNLRGVVIASDKFFNQTVAGRIAGKFKIGWSFCRTTKQVKPNGKVIPPDRFDRQKGLMIARGRVDIPSTAQVPRDVQPIIDKMAERAQRYFKD